MSPMMLVRRADSWIIDHPAQAVVQFAYDREVSKRSLVIGGQVVMFIGFCFELIVLSQPSLWNFACLAVLGVVTSLSAANPVMHSGRAVRLDVWSLCFRITWLFLLVSEVVGGPFAALGRTAAAMGVDLAALFSLYVAATDDPAARSRKRKVSKSSAISAGTA